MPLAEILRAIADELAAMEVLIRELADHGDPAPRVGPAPTTTPEEEAVTPAAPKVLSAKTQPTGRGRDGLGPRTQLVLEALRAGDKTWIDGWVAAAPLAKKLGMTQPALKTHLQILGGRGLVETKGETSARRYRAYNPDNESVGSAPVLDAHPDPRQAPEPPPIEKPVEANTTPPTPPATATELRVTRSRILDHLSRRRLSVQSLVGTLNLRTAVVEEVCEGLLAEGKIVVLPNGNYEHADGIR